MKNEHRGMAEKGCNTQEQETATRRATQKQKLCTFRVLISVRKLLYPNDDQTIPRHRLSAFWRGDKTMMFSLPENG